MQEYRCLTIVHNQDLTVKAKGWADPVTLVLACSNFDVGVQGDEQVDLNSLSSNYYIYIETNGCWKLQRAQNLEHAINSITLTAAETLKWLTY